MNKSIKNGQQKKDTPYGKIETIGGIFMPREYRHIQQYEKEILRLREEGLTYREIGEKLGFSKKQIKEFFGRLHTKERKLAAGTPLRKKGKPPKDYVVTEEMKLQELRYIIARKDSKIRALEMENELLRDFLSLTERK